VNEKNISDDDLEEELEKALKKNEDKKDIFKIIRGEKESLGLREKRLKKKHKLKS
jgi:hypothetical protein